MTTELWILVAAAALQWTLIMSAATPRLLANGIFYSAGNRHEEAKPVPEWALRTQKASDNLAENLVLFAILVLVAHAAGVSGGLALLGAQIFLGARVVHAPLYIIGVPWLRTAVWGVSLVGMGMIGASLF